MAPTSHTPPSEFVPNMNNKDLGESCAKTSPPNQNPQLANVPFAKDNTKPILANSGKS